MKTLTLLILLLIPNIANAISYRADPDTILYGLHYTTSTANTPAYWELGETGYLEASFSPNSGLLTLDALFNLALGINGNFEGLPDAFNKPVEVHFEGIVPERFISENDVFCLVPEILTGVFTIDDEELFSRNPYSMVFDSITAFDHIGLYAPFSTNALGSVTEFGILTRRDGAFVGANLHSVPNPEPATWALLTLVGIIAFVREYRHARR